jgi:hypothetical protein
MDPVTLGIVLGLIGAAGRWGYKEVQYYRSAEKTRKDKEAAERKAAAARAKAAQGRDNEAKVARLEAQAKAFAAELERRIQQLKSSPIGELERKRDAARKPGG